MGARIIEERVCENVAAQLLMPEDRFVKSARDYEPSFDAIRQLAVIYDVSFEAALLRVAETQPWPSTMLIEWTTERGSAHASPAPRSLRSMQSRTTFSQLTALIHSSALNLQNVYAGIARPTIELVGGSRLESVRARLGRDDVIVSLLWDPHHAFIPAHSRNDKAVTSNR